MTGYQSKKTAALDEDGMYLVHQTTPVQFNCTVVDDQHPQGIPLEQWGDPPAAQQEPVVGTKTWFEDGKVVTQYLTAKDIYKEPEQERNFCPRCGKRTNDIHTCTPPQEST